MEVEQAVPITTGAPGINGDSNVVIVEEKEQRQQAIHGASAVTNGGDGAPEAEQIGHITRSASCHDQHRQAKKRGAFGLFRAVFTSFGGGSMRKRDAAIDQIKKGGSDKLAAAEAAASDGATWKNLVDGMRPLRLHGHLEYYPPPPPSGHDVYHDVLLPPPSPARLSEGMTSRYASAQDLRQLDGGNEVEAEAEDEEKGGDPATEGGGGCPNAIDMQAEEFIAKFYAQFRLQKSDSFNNRSE